MLYTPEDFGFTFETLAIVENARGEILFAAPASDLSALKEKAREWTRRFGEPVIALLAEVAVDIETGALI